MYYYTPYSIPGYCYYANSPYGRVPGRYRFRCPLEKIPYTRNVESAGHWHTTWGDMNLYFSEVVGNMSGHWHNGTMGDVHGTFTKADNKFVGIWEQADQGSGQLILNFSPDYSSFTGSFNNDGYSWLWLPWNGSR